MKLITESRKKEGPMDGVISFGRWLSARRHLPDLTQDELAQRVGCSVVTIRKLEADERRTSKQVAERLANSLGIAQSERLGVRAGTLAR